MAQEIGNCGVVGEVDDHVRFDVAVFCGFENRIVGFHFAGSVDAGNDLHIFSCRDHAGEYLAHTSVAAVQNDV